VEEIRFIGSTTDEPHLAWWCWVAISNLMLRWDPMFGWESRNCSWILDGGTIITWNPVDPLLMAAVYLKAEFQELKASSRIKWSVECTSIEFCWHIGFLCRILGISRLMV
jgi:hypothetical protein